MTYEQNLSRKKKNYMHIKNYNLNYNKHNNIVLFLLKNIYYFNLSYIDTHIRIHIEDKMTL